MSQRSRRGQSPPHTVQRSGVGDWRDNQLSGVLEANASAIKQVVDRRRQQKAVFPIEAFLIARIAPRLAVASDQVNRVIDAGHSTTVLNLHYSLLEKPLPTPGHNEGFAIGVRDQPIGLDRGFDVMLPHLQVRALGLWDLLRLQ